MYSHGGYAVRFHIYTAIHGEMVENDVPIPVLSVVPDIVMPVTDTEQLPLILWVWFMSAPNAWLDVASTSGLGDVP